MNFDSSDHILRTFKEAIRDYVDTRIEAAKKKQESTLVHRLGENIKHLFQFIKQDSSPERRLAGRITEVNQTADKALEFLKQVKESLKEEVDDDLHPFIEGMLQPMIRDVMRIRRTVREDGPIHMQAEAFENYNRWMDDAILLVELCTKTRDKESISKMFVKHTFDEIATSIDRDLQFIDDYLAHEMEKLQLSEAEMYVLAETAQEKLKRYIQSLLSLKKQPSNLSLDNLSSWKEVADRRRNRHLDAILEAIDELLDIQKGETKSEQSLLKKLAYLEMEIPMLCDKVFDGTKKINEFEEEMILPQLLSLEQELDELNRENSKDYSESIQERLDLLNEMIGQAFKLLKK